MVRLISRQRWGLAALKLIKLFGIDDFPAAKDSGKVFIIITHCYLIIIIIIIINIIITHIIKYNVKMMFPGRRSLFPFRKQSIPFLKVGNQAFQNGRCYISTLG